MRTQVAELAQHRIAMGEVLLCSFHMMPPAETFREREYTAQRGEPGPLKESRTLDRGSPRGARSSDP